MSPSVIAVAVPSLEIVRNMIRTVNMRCLERTWCIGMELFEVEVGTKQRQPPNCPTRRRFNLYFANSRFFGSPLRRSRAPPPFASAVIRLAERPRLIIKSYIPNGPNGPNGPNS